MNKKPCEKKALNKRPVGNYLRLLKEAMRRGGCLRHENGASSRRRNNSHGWSLLSSPAPPGSGPGRWSQLQRPWRRRDQTHPDWGIKMKLLFQLLEWKTYISSATFSGLISPSSGSILISVSLPTTTYKEPRLASQNNAFASSDSVIRTANSMILYCLTAAYVCPVGKTTACCS